MERNTIVQQNPMTILKMAVDYSQNTIKNMVGNLVKPLQKYYAHVLEKEITTRQTLLLLNAQTAFIFGVFPVECPFMLRVLFGVWLLLAVLKCKKEGC